MITLEPFPLHAEDIIYDLYTHTDQSSCLVPVFLESPKEAQRYTALIGSGINDGKPFLCRAVMFEGQIIGKIELTRYDDESAELDIILRREYTGKGYGTQAVIELVYLVSARKWCENIRAYVSSENKAAGRCLMKVGFRPVRKFRADVMAPAGGEYRLAEKEGYEFILPVPEIQVH